MRRLPWLTLGVTVLCGVALLARPAAHPPQTAFTAGVELVRLAVVVLDRRGAPVTGLGAEDFEVLEDGRAQPIASFTEGPPGQTVPLRLGLALDKSISMEKDLPEAADAAVTFITAMDDAADITLLEFDATVRLARFTRDDYPRLFERVRDTKIGYGTALYDTVGRYLTDAADRPGQHVLVVFTDGGDSSSRLTLSEVITRLRRGNTVVYAIGYLDRRSVGGDVVPRAALSRMARETGGEAFFPVSRADLDRIYSRIRGEVAGRYTLGYVAPTPAVAPGARAGARFRRVSVRVVRPDLKGLVVRVRSGYIAGS